MPNGVPYVLVFFVTLPTMTTPPIGSPPKGSPTMISPLATAGHRTMLTVRNDRVGKDLSGVSSPLDSLYWAVGFIDTSRSAAIAGHDVID